MARDLRADRKALEGRLAELESATRQLHSTQDQLIRSEKLASVGRLSAGIAHEIGNPLAAILGFVELLQTGDLPEPDEREFLRRVKNEVERIHRIIRELLDYSRAEPGAPATRRARRPGPGGGGSRQARGPPEGPAWRHHRAPLCRQPELGARLRGRPAAAHPQLAAQCRRCRERRWLNPDRAQTRPRTRSLLSISDSGTGIPEAMLGKLFEPFVTSKPPGKGTGLGLAVSHAIVSASGAASAPKTAPRAVPVSKCACPRGAEHRAAVSLSVA